MKLTGSRDIAPPDWCRVKLNHGRIRGGRCGDYAGHAGDHWNTRELRNRRIHLYKWDDNGVLLRRVDVTDPVTKQEKPNAVTNHR